MFGHEVIFTENIISSFNNNALLKCTNDKGFYIMAAAQFFCNINLRTPGSFGMLCTPCSDDVLR